MLGGVDASLAHLVAQPVGHLEVARALGDDPPAAV
jgi:hypothetical protein